MGIMGQGMDQTPVDIGKPKVKSYIISEIQAV